MIVQLVRSGHCNKFSPRSAGAMLRENTKKKKKTTQRAPSLSVQASVCMSNVKVHDNTSKIQKRVVFMGYKAFFCEINCVLCCFHKKQTLLTLNLHKR